MLRRAFGNAAILTRRPHLQAKHCPLDVGNVCEFTLSMKCGMCRLCHSRLVASEPRFNTRGVDGDGKHMEIVYLFDEWAPYGSWGVDQTFEIRVLAIHAYFYVYYRLGKLVFLPVDFSTICHFCSRLLTGNALPRNDPEVSGSARGHPQFIRVHI